MALSDDRFITVGESRYPWEREAVAFAFEQLRDRGDPFQGRALVELLDSGSGSLYEIDLLLIGYSAIYLVEIKSHPGKIEGDHVDWIWTPPEGRRTSGRTRGIQVGPTCLRYAVTWRNGHAPAGGARGWTGGHASRVRGRAKSSRGDGAPPRKA